MLASQPPAPSGATMEAADEECTTPLRRMEGLHNEAAASDTMQGEMAAKLAAAYEALALAETAATAALAEASGLRQQQQEQAATAAAALGALRQEVEDLKVLTMTNNLAQLRQQPQRQRWRQQWR
eukprot:SM007944S22514  [mRNA]  locus=s7944:112:584:+ [translate_table: standard]